MFDLIHGQHARQHGAADAEQLLHHIDGLVIGGRSLHRHVQPQVRIPFRHIGHNGEVGDNHRIRAKLCRRIHRGIPARHLPGLCERINRHQHIASARMGVGHALPRRLHVEIQTGEVTRIGRVFQPHVHRVCTVVHRRFQSGQVAGGTNQFGNFPHFVFLVRRRNTVAHQSIFCINPTILLIKHTKYNDLNQTVKSVLITAYCLQNLNGFYFLYISYA